MGPNEPGWLFKEGDLILGPVAAQALIEKLYAGELNAGSEVQLMGTGHFSKLGEIPDFKVHVAKSEAKRRVDAHAAAHQSAQAKKTRRSLIVAAGILSVVGVAVAIVGSYFAVHGFGSKAQISFDPPTIKKAERSLDDEFVDYRAGGKRPTTRPVAPGDPRTNNPSPGSTDPDGLSLGAVDEAGINAVVSKSRNTLNPCIMAIAKPGVSMKIPIEFSIAEAGRVSKVWVDNTDLKGSGLEECLLRELQKWPFKPTHSGNSVNLTFNVGKKG